MKVQSLLPLLLAFALPVLGCEARVSLGGRCMTDAQCPRPLVCGFGRCRAECATASDCRDPGAFCIGEPGSGVCSVPSVDTCASSCTDGLVCAGETCALPCDPLGDDCLGGSECAPRGAVNVCVATPTVDAGAEDAGRDARVPDANLDAGSIVPGPHRELCLGEAHACAIRSGRVYCWGAGAEGQLGDGTDDAAGTPQSGCSGACAPRPMRAVSNAGTGDLTGVIALACGAAHTCALTDTGLAFCWGSSGSGALGSEGRGGHVAILVPSIEGATAIVSGRVHTCVDTPSGPWCWGHNSRDGIVIDNRLGSTGASALEERPVAATLFAGSIAMAGGGYFTCVAPDDGRGVTCFGTNEAGAVGPEPVWSSTSPSARPDGVVIAGTEGATALGAGVVHACALVGGRARCWGGGGANQLASSDTDPCIDAISSPCRGDARPVRDPDDRTLVALSTGYGLTQCAVVIDGSVVCWGATDRGEAGYPGAQRSVEVLGSAVAGIPQPVSEVESANQTSCARSDDGRVFCWGSNESGQLGCDVPPDSLEHPSACEVAFP